MKVQKEIIQERVYQVFKVHVDQVLQGAGTTNNGNTTRTCFKDPQKFAQTLGIDEEIVERLAFVILAFKQKQILNQQILKNYSIETYRLIYRTYPWVEIPPTVHKLLRHGVDIQSQLKLPVSYYAEDAGESAHKYYRNNSTDHARQTSRANRLLDVFNFSVYYSDPLNSCYYLDARVQHMEHGKDLPDRFKTIFNI